MQPVVDLDIKHRDRTPSSARVDVGLGSGYALALVVSSEVIE